MKVILNKTLKRRYIKMDNKLTGKQVEELKSLLCSWKYYYL